MAEVSAELAEENTTSSEAADLLEAEATERMKLEKEFRELQVLSSRVSSNLVMFCMHIM